MRSGDGTAENRMITGPGSAALAYDATGRLSQSVGAGVTTRFGYDGTRLTGEYNATGTLLRRYIHGPGTDDPLLWYEGPGTSDRRWLHADERGSIVAVSNSAGSVIALNAYDEYGIPAATNMGRFGYTGQTWLPEVSLYYYKARVYSPYLGRFMQTDPIGYGDGVDWYAYVDDDPVNRGDPSGLDAFQDAGNVVRGAVEVVLGGIGFGVGAAGAVASGGLEGGTLGGASVVAIPSAAASVAVMGASIAVGADGARRLTEGLRGLVSEARSKTDPDGDPAAQGRPHSVPDGKGGYTTYGRRDPTTGKPESTKQYRPAPGKPHGNIERPNVKDRPANTRPDGARVPGRPEVRPPKPEEVRK
jgi:RHS repeat-associated protein